MGIKLVLNEFFKNIKFQKCLKRAHKWFNSKIIILRIFRNLFDCFWTLKLKVMK